MTATDVPLGRAAVWARAEVVQRQMAKAAATMVAREKNVVTFSTPCLLLVVTRGPATQLP